MYTELASVTNQTNVPEHQAQVDHDEQLVAIWLYGKSGHTRRAYEKDIEDFRKYTEYKPLCSLRLQDLQRYDNSLTRFSARTHSRKLAAVKSLYTFGTKLGYFKFNVAAALQTPKIKNNLAERILTEGEVIKMITLEDNSRNKVILGLLYHAGLRAAELAGLKKKDLTSREGGGQITVHGKGEKTRFIRVYEPLWTELTKICFDHEPEDPVFISREKDGHLTVAHLCNIVRKTAKKAGIDKPVSPHWLRHYHATHALDRGAPIHLVQNQLGHRNLATTGKYTHVRPQDGSGQYLPIF